MHHQQQQLAQYCNYYPGPPQGRGLPAQGEKNLGQQVFFGQIIRVAGDGRCLFRAIARHIASMERRTLDQRAEQKRADELRALAHKTVSVDRKDWFQKSGAIEGDFSEYCRAMKVASPCEASTCSDSCIGASNLSMWRTFCRVVFHIPFARIYSVHIPTNLPDMNRSPTFTGAKWSCWH